MENLGGDGDTVSGLAGRLRLQRSRALEVDDGKASDQKLNDGSWMDVGRKYIQAYEYLCHVGEAKQWIESCLQETAPPTSVFEESLRDGVILAQLAQAFRPDIVKKIFIDPKLQFRHSDNINYFYRFLHESQLPELFIFELTDLYDAKNMPKVIYCIHALSHLLAKDGKAPKIKNLVGELNFTEEELQNKQEHLQETGMPIPSFHGIDKKLATEMAPIPELTEEEKRQQWLQENVETIERLQAQARAFTARCQHRDRLQHFLDNERDVTRCQALYRGREVRKEVQARKRYWAENEGAINLIQSHCRGYLKRKKRDADAKYWADKKDAIVLVQSLWRGRQERLKRDADAQYWSENETAVILAQSRWKGRQQKRAYAARLAHFRDNEDIIVRMQAMRRAKKERDSYKSRLDYLKSQGDAIRTIQACIRGTRACNNYNNLNSENPPIGTVQNFLHLLEEDDRDWQEEIELQTTKQTVVRRIRENLESEDWLNDLDIKIALLVKNRVSLDEVSRLAKRMRTRRGSTASPNGSPTGSETDLAGDVSPVAYLKALDVESRRRLDNYQNMFYLLQTDPSYLTKLFYLMRSWSADVVKRYVETCVPSLFSFGQNEREEYLLLKLFRCSIEYEVQDSHSVQDYVRSNPTFIKLVVQYTRGAKERKYLRDLLNPVLQRVFDLEGELDLDPINIYKASIREQELRTGQRSSKQFEVSREEALTDPETRERFIKNLHVIRDLVELALSEILGSLEKMPYGIRFIAKELRKVLAKHFPDEVEDTIMRVIGNLLYYRYMNPAIIAPDVFDVCEVIISPSQRKTLSEIAKLLHSISVARVFSASEPHLVPLNEYLGNAIQRFHRFLLNAVNVPEPEERFRLDAFSEVAMTTKPVIYISPDEIFTMHATLMENANHVCGGPEDPMRQILTELKAPPVFGVQQTRVNKEGPKMESVGSPGFQGPSYRTSRSQAPEIALKLTNRFVSTNEDSSALQVKKLMLETKKMIVMVLRVQPATSDLVQLLCSGVSEEDEVRYQQLVKSDETSRRARRMKSTSMVSMFKQSQIQQESGATLVGTDVEPRRPESYIQLKGLCLENLATLEGLGLVSGGDYYQEMLNEIAREITSKRERRFQRSREVNALKETLNNVDDKARYLDEQIRSYQEYVNACIGNMTVGKKSARRNPLPFTRQYFHNRELARSGRAPQFGSYKYTARQLLEKGVLEEITADGVSQKMFDRIHLTVSSNEPGVFDIEAAFAPALGMALATDKTVIRLDELLQYQFNNVQSIEIMDCAKVNVNLMLYFINKRFFQ